MGRLDNIAIAGGRALPVHLPIHLRPMQSPEASPQQHPVFLTGRVCFREKLLIFSVPIIELAVRGCGQKSYINRSLNPVCEYRNGIPGRYYLSLPLKIHL